MLKILNLRYSKSNKKKMLFTFCFIQSSRNQLTFIPASLCKLPNLEVLILNNNKLISLPEEIGQLEKLIELVKFTANLQKKRNNCFTFPGCELE